jgi:hypothetical protein
MTANEPTSKIVELRLSRPFEVRGKMVGVLKFRPPRRVDLVVANPGFRSGPKVRQARAALNLISILSGVPRSAIDSMSLDDIKAAARLVAELSGITIDAQSKEE